MIKEVIKWAIVIGFCVVVWYRPLSEIVIYVVGVLIGIGVWGSILLDKTKDRINKLVGSAEEARNSIIADIDKQCEVKSCSNVKEITCLGIDLCYDHWRILRPKGMKCVWGFKQKKNAKIEKRY